MATFQKAPLRRFKFKRGRLPSPLQPNTTMRNITLTFLLLGLSLTTAAQNQFLNTVKLVLDLDTTQALPQAVYDTLQELDLAGYQLTNLSPIENFKGLEYLYLSNNSITDVSPLTKLQHLKYVNLRANKITDISPFILTYSEDLTVVIYENCVQDFAIVDENYFNTVTFIGKDNQGSACNSPAPEFTRLYHLDVFPKDLSKNEVYFMYRGESNVHSHATFGAGDGKQSQIKMTGYTDTLVYTYPNSNLASASMSLGDSSKQVDVRYALGRVNTVRPEGQVSFPADSLLEFAWDTYFQSPSYEFELRNSDSIIMSFSTDTTTVKYRLDTAKMGTTLYWSVRAQRAFSSSGWSLPKTIDLVFNQEPTDIQLSKTAIAENQPAETTIGLLTTTDPNSDDSHTYTLESGTEYFKIENAVLKSKISFDYETKASYPITIKTTDKGNLSYSKKFTITISDVNETEKPTALANPTLKSGAITLYPNPTTGQVRFEGLDPKQSLKIQIVNSLGRLVKTFNQIQSSYDLSKLPKGIYIAVIQLEDGSQTFKFVLR